jgi:hypothetical protein
MKYRKKVENLKRAQDWWDRQPNSFKSETKRPGSVKQRIITGNK